MGRPTALRLYGLVHVADRNKVERAVGDIANGSDALFVEYPRDPPSALDLIHGAVRTPAAFVGAAIYNIGLSPLLLASTHDLLPPGYLAALSVTDAEEISVHHIDEHPRQLLLDARPRTIVWNWMILIPFVAVAPTWTTAVLLTIGLGGTVPWLLRRHAGRATGIGSLLVGIVAAVAVFLAAPNAAQWLVAVNLVAFLIVVQTTLTDRDETMLERFLEISDQEGYEEVALVVGKAHTGGIVRLANDCSIVVPAVRLWRWRQDDLVFEDDVDPEDLPGAQDPRTHPETVPDSENAAFRRRIPAALVDLVAIAGLWFLLTAVLLDAIDVLFGDPGGWASLVLLVAPWIVAATGYHALFEWRWGATIGKRLMCVYVVNVDPEFGDVGDLPSRGQALLRNAVRPFGALALYGVGGLSALATDRWRTIGDLLAGTVVRRRQDGSEDS